MQSVDDFLSGQKDNSQSNPQLQSVDDFLATSSTIVPTDAPITQNYGNYNPSLEVFSGGVARDTNFAVNPNTPIHVPQGQWEVVSAYNDASPEGSVGDGSNEGYGNAVIVQNTETGDKLHLIHLAHVMVKPGQVLPTGSMVGLSGSSGNATGPNLGVEYYDSQGNIGDVMQSPYAQYLPNKQGDGGSGGGGFLGIIGNAINGLQNFLSPSLKSPLPKPEATAPIPASDITDSSLKQESVLPQSRNSQQSSPMQTVKGNMTKVLTSLGSGGSSNQAEASSLTPTPTSIPQAIGATDYEKQAAPIFAKYGVPPPIGIGIWAMEGRGKTINPNNPYNIGAYDDNPQNANAYAFKTPIEGTEEAAKFLAGQSQYMASDKKAIFQKAMNDLKENHDIDAYLRAIAPTYSSNPNYADIVESTPEYQRWAGGN